MNKLFIKLLLLVSCFYTTWVKGQTLVSPITITLPTNPPANIADWATAMPPVMILAQGKMRNGQVDGLVQESKILVTIKSGGNKVCGSYTPQTAPLSNFNTATKSWSGTNAVGLLGQSCVLQPGNYELCVQFYAPGASQANLILIGESCKPFTIKENTKETYSPPQNIAPANEKKLTDKEANAPIVFRWTPVIPKPQTSVTYKLRVWQLMQGQTATAAIKGNRPVLEREVKNQTQFVKPNLMGDIEMLNGTADLVWRVSATGEQNENFGESEPTGFKIIITDPSAGCFSLDTTQYKVECNGYDAQGKPKYKLTNLILKNTGTNPGRTGLITTAATPYIIPVGFTVSSPSPGSATGIMPTNAVPISFEITGATGPTATFYIYATIPDPGGDPNVACDKRFKVVVDLPSCKCNTCDEKNIGWEIQSKLYYDSTTTNNILTLHNDVAINPLLKVVKLSTEIVDFYWYTEGDCKRCNKNDFYWGNIISGTINGNKFVNQGTSVADETGVPLTSSHQLDFISSSPTGTSLSAGTWLNISLPPQTALSCCTDCFRFCVRYTITFMENGVCKTCSIVKCYETKRKHRKIFRKPNTQLPMNDCGEILIHQGGDIKGNIK